MLTVNLLLSLFKQSFYRLTTEPELAGTSSVFYLDFFENETLGDKWHRFLQATPFWSPIESVKGLKATRDTHGRLQ